MNGFKLDGDVKDVCAELRAIADKYKGWTVDTFLRLLRIEEDVAKQFGMPVEEYRRTVYGV